MNDTERLNWLEKQDGAGVISDDNGRWAVPDSGFQNLQDDEGNFITDQAIDVESMFLIPAAFWKPSLREAIDDAVRRAQDEAD
jgi:hypothetical protein